MSRNTGSETDFPNGVKTFPRDVGNSKVKTAAYTVLAADLLGSTIIVDSDAAVVITLPLIAGAGDGAIVTIVNNKPGQLLTVDPNNADGISFADAATDGVTIVNTALTAKKGDYITLVTLSAASTFWNISAISGIWAAGA